MQWILIMEPESKFTQYQRQNPTKLRQIKLQNVLQICYHTEEQNIDLFSNKVKTLNNIIIIIIIIIIITMWQFHVKSSNIFGCWHLTSQMLSTPSPPTDNAKMTNPRKIQPSTLHNTEATETIFVRPLQKVKFKKCL